MSQHILNSVKNLNCLKEIKYLLKIKIPFTTHFRNLFAEVTTNKPL